MNRLIVTGAALLLSSGAYAADLSQSYKTPAPPVAVPTWTGFYAGVNAGYGFNARDYDVGGQTYYANTSGDTVTETQGPGGPAWATPANLKGYTGGIQGGYNYQLRSWVFGVETDFNYGNLKSAASASNTTAIPLFPTPPGGGNLWPVSGNLNATESINWYGTVRGRVGVAVSDWLLYGTGGLAYGQVKQTFGYSGGFNADAALGFGGSSFAGSASSSTVKVGWAAGGGLEYRLFTNWSLKLEYLFTDLGSVTTSLTAPAFRNSDGAGNRTVQASNTMDAEFQRVVAGINYRF